MSDHDINKVLVIDQSKKFQRVLVRFFSEHYPNTEIKVYDLKKWMSRQYLTGPKMA